MKCIIPCAGYATRLGEAGVHTPKSLIKIRGKFLIDHIIESLLDLDIDEFVVISNAKFYDQFKEWFDNFSCKIKIRLINDGTTSNETRLGTLNDIKLALNDFDDDFLVYFGDTFVNFDMKKANEFFKEKKAPVMVLCDIGLENAKRSAIIGLDENDRVTSIEEKPENPTFSLCSAGIYFCIQENKKDIEKYLEEGKNSEGIVYFLEDIMNKPLFGYVYDKETNFYIDVGVPEAIDRANKIDE
tara:strand:+ start:6076 stop:6801 length:726 start_codon:yes stop_codon:yes gene_type:complete